MENPSDSELIFQYLNGTTDAFGVLVNRYTQLVYRFVLKVLNNNNDEAHDVTQETLIKAWKNIKKFDRDKNFKPWIFTIAQRTALDFLRKRKNISFTALDDEKEFSFEQNIPDTEILADEAFERDENVTLIQNAFEKISIESKMIVLLRNGEDMTFEEIAEVLDKPMNTIKSKYRRALSVLKKEIISQSAPKQT